MRSSGKGREVAAMTKGAGSLLSLALGLLTDLQKNNFLPLYGKQPSPPWIQAGIFVNIGTRVRKLFNHINFPSIGLYADNSIISCCQKKSSGRQT